METQIQGASGYYVWQAPGAPVSVHIHLSVIDAMLAEIMRGFGAVPKRGAEIGGLLLGSTKDGSNKDGSNKAGSVQDGEGVIVRIEDFKPVPCGYTRGPSYLLSPEEREAFDAACANARPESGRETYAVGYFRSHTRDGMSLAAEDLELLDRYFPASSAVALLVKPFATKAGPAGFFFREDGEFQAITPLEFPFRRREITGEEAPERRPLTERRPRGQELQAAAEPEAFLEQTRMDPARFGFAPGFAQGAPPGLAYAITTPPRSRLGSWMWIPLSFIFLLLGVALGYLAALNVQPRGGSAAAADYSLSMAVLKTGDALSLQWNADAPVIRRAERGELEIHDGDYSKTVPLDASKLRNGKLTFQNSSNAVTFRLTVNLNSSLSVSESVAWHR
jgi:hypothetical protein